MSRISMIAVAVTLVLLSTPSQAEKLAPGAHEYRQSCAVCHGTNAKGHGQLCEVLSVKVPDLNLPSKRNSGVFPFERIDRVVGGRQTAKAHGSSELPVWRMRY